MQTISGLEAQINVLETKLENYIPHPQTGKFDSGYYALKNKIKTLNRTLAAKKPTNQGWNEFLAR